MRKIYFKLTCKIHFNNYNSFDAERFNSMLYH